MMQAPNAAPRDGLTAQQVLDLIERAQGVVVDKGCELLDMNLMVLGDISGDMAPGGGVRRDAYATLHGSAQLRLARQLDWGTALVRPYYVMSDGVISARFNLGAYFTSNPRESYLEDVRIHDVTGYDILHGLADRVGGSYSVGAGVGYLAQVEEIFQARGYTKYIIDPTAVGKVLPQPRPWVLDDNVTWLTICNDLLAAIGYQGVWSDWDGNLRAESYQRPIDRGPEWVYSHDPETSLLDLGRVTEIDLYEAPNRWVGVMSNVLDGPAPIPGAGMFEYINQTYGPTSVEARGNRVITAPLLSLDVADQASLEAEVLKRVDSDLRLKRTHETPTWPNPLHWHFDRVALQDDPDVSTLSEMLSTSWVLPFDGGLMTHEWSFL